PERGGDISTLDKRGHFYFALTVQRKKLLMGLNCGSVQAAIPRIGAPYLCARPGGDVSEPEHKADNL
ncbi:MAG: hypothetical protein OXT64_12090, partial [Gammaproteobacteria bacterium]|nr:hypothetical protein [Gammaproteobacteria bacterium]